MGRGDAAKGSKKGKKPSRKALFESDPMKALREALAKEQEFSSVEALESRAKGFKPIALDELISRPEPQKEEFIPPPLPKPAGPLSKKSGQSMPLPPSGLPVPLAAVSKPKAAPGAPLPPASKSGGKKSGAGQAPSASASLSLPFFSSKPDKPEPSGARPAEKALDVKRNVKKFNVQKPFAPPLQPVSVSYLPKPPPVRPQPLGESEKSLASPPAPPLPSLKGAGAGPSIAPPKPSLPSPSSKPAPVPSKPPSAKMSSVLDALFKSKPSAPSGGFGALPSGGKPPAPPSSGAGQPPFPPSKPSGAGAKPPAPPASGALKPPVPLAKPDDSKPSLHWLKSGGSAKPLLPPLKPAAGAPRPLPSSKPSVAPPPSLPLPSSKPPLPPFAPSGSGAPKPSLLSSLFSPKKADEDLAQKYFPPLHSDDSRKKPIFVVQKKAQKTEPALAPKEPGVPAPKPSAPLLPSIFKPKPLQARATEKEKSKPAVLPSAQVPPAPAQKQKPVSLIVSHEPPKPPLQLVASKPEEILRPAGQKPLPARPPAQKPAQKRPLLSLVFSPKPLNVRALPLIPPPKPKAAKALAPRPVLAPVQKQTPVSKPALAGGKPSGPPVFLPEKDTLQEQPSMFGALAGALKGQKAKPLPIPQHVEPPVLVPPLSSEKIQNTSAKPAKASPLFAQAQDAGPASKGSKPGRPPKQVPSAFSQPEDLIMRPTFTKGLPKESFASQGPSIPLSKPQEEAPAAPADFVTGEPVSKRGQKKKGRFLPFGQREEAPERDETFQPPESQGPLESLASFSEKLQVGPGAGAPASLVLDEGPSARPSVPSSSSSKPPKPYMLEAVDPREFNMYYLKDMELPRFGKASCEAYFASASLEQKKFLHALHAERLYWRYKNEPEGGPNHSQYESEFMSFLENSGPEQRISIELVINLTKGLKAIGLFTSPSSDQKTAKEAFAICNSLMGAHPALKPLLYFAAGRLGMKNAYSPNSLEPARAFLDMVSRSDEELRDAVYAMRAAFFDRLMNSSSASSSLRHWSADRYARILMARPQISQKLELYKQAHRGIELFFASVQSTDPDAQRKLGEEWTRLVNDRSQVRVIVFYVLAHLFSSPGPDALSLTALGAPAGRSSKSAQGGRH